MAAKNKMWVLFLIITILSFSKIYAQETIKDVFVRGEKHFMAGEFNKALIDFTKVIKLDSNCAQAY